MLIAGFLIACAGTAAGYRFWTRSTPSGQTWRYRRMAQKLAGYWRLERPIRGNNSLSLVAARHHGGPTSVLRFPETHRDYGRLWTLAERGHSTEFRLGFVTSSLLNPVRNGDAMKADAAPPPDSPTCFLELL